MGRIDIVIFWEKEANTKRILKKLSKKLSWDKKSLEINNFSIVILILIVF